MLHWFHYDGGTDIIIPTLLQLQSENNAYLVGLHGSCDVCVKGVHVLHDELSATDDSETRSHLVTELVCSLVKSEKE